MSVDIEKHLWELKDKVYDHINNDQEVKVGLRKDMDYLQEDVRELKQMDERMLKGQEDHGKILVSLVEFAKTGSDWRKTLLKSLVGPLVAAALMWFAIQSLK